MDEISLWILSRLSEMFPKAAIRIKPMFLGSPDSEGGFVPFDWDGSTIISSGYGGYVTNL